MFFRQQKMQNRDKLNELWAILTKNYAVANLGGINTS